MSSILSFRFSAAFLGFALLVNAAAGAQLNVHASKYVAKHFLATRPAPARNYTIENGTKHLASLPVATYTYQHLRDSGRDSQIAGVRAYFDNDCMDQFEPGAFYAVYPTNGLYGWSLEKLWERQYLQDLLFKDAHKWRLCVLNMGSMGPGPLVQLLEHANRHGKPATLIATTNEVGLGLVELAGMMAQSEAARVKLFVHLSDERIEEDIQKYAQIVAYGGLVLRQYNNWLEQPPKGIRVRSIPLGYSSEYPVSADSCSAAMQNSPANADRAYAWSWVGNIHGSTDRHQMLDMLDTYPTLQPFVHHKCNATTMYDLYSKSMFVPIGRGYASLDCFRIYEAAITGAVPVVVGPTSEVIGTFLGHKDMPAVFADTWLNAAEQMKQLLADRTKWLNLAHRLGPWYCNWIQSLRAEVAEVLGH